jgi:Rap1a immunity proteins
MKLWPIAAVALIFASCPAESNNFYTAQELQTDCSDHSASSISSIRTLLCLHYIAGFVDGIRANEDPKRSAEKLWCFPKGITLGQARQVIEKYMRDNPQVLHLEAAGVAGLALLTAFPCK